MTDNPWSASQARPQDVGGVKVAAVQMAATCGDTAGNVARAVAMVRAAAQAGARLIALPECVVGGYIFASRGEAARVAEPVPGPSVDRLAAVAREHAVYVVAGLVEREADRLYNTAVLLGPEGYLGKYHKNHLPWLGLDRFADRGYSGDYVVYDTAIGRIGLQICYDLYPPESTRLLALRGAQIIVNPAAWAAGSDILPSFFTRTRACENRIYLVACDRAGEERGVPYIGRSQIVGTAGRIIAELPHDREEILYGVIYPQRADTKHVVLVPGEFEVDIFKDRRPELYEPLTRT